MGSDEHQAASERRRTGRRLATRQTAAVGASALLLAGAAACGEAPAEPQASGGSKAADSGASGDASAALPVMLSTFGGVHPGMSNIDSYGLIGFSWAPTNGSLANLTPIIEANAFFVDATGARIDAEVVPVEIDEGEPPPTPWFQLRAKRELAKDAWHWVVVRQSAVIQVIGADPAGDWSSHFFTGSFPRIIGVTGSLEKNPLSVGVTFSEPVDLAKVPVDRLVTRQGKPIAQCLLRGVQCLDPAQPFVWGSANVRLTEPFDASGLAFSLEGSVPGSGGTVGEGAAAAGVELEAGALRVAPEAAEWVACHEGTSLCWGERRAAPATSR